MKNQLKQIERSWILYDVGNSAYILLVTTILPIYFKQLATKDGISAANYMAYWGYAASISTIIVALSGPLLGTLSDRKGWKKPLFLGSVLLGGLSCLCLGVPSSWRVFIALYVISKIGYSISLIFYDSMLTDITVAERMDLISSKGFAWGYIGSCLPFLAGLALILGHNSIGIEFQTAVILAFLVTALWWILLTLPLLFRYQQLHFITKDAYVFGSGFRQLGKTLQEIVKKPEILLFLIAFFFYIDGVYTIIDMATAYGEAIGLHTSGLLLALLLTQIIAFPAALAFGKLARHFAAEKLITICITAYLFIALYAIQLDRQSEFWFLAICIGLFQGGIQALSRSYFARLIPAEKSGEYFGILDICGKGASFLGTGLVSLLIQFTGNTGKGVSIISLLILAGLIFFRLSLRQQKRETVLPFPAKKQKL